MLTGGALPLAPLFPRKPRPLSKALTLATRLPADLVAAVAVAVVLLVAGTTTMMTQTATRSRHLASLIQPTMVAGKAAAVLTGLTHLIAAVISVAADIRPMALVLRSNANAVPAKSLLINATLFALTSGLPMARFTLVAMISLFATNAATVSPPLEALLAPLVSRRSSARPPASARGLAAGLRATAVTLTAFAVLTVIIA